MLEESTGAYSWHCLLCEAYGYKGQTGYERHYAATHGRGDARTYLTFLKEAREEFGLTGGEAYEWAFNAWTEYRANQ